MSQWSKRITVTGSSTSVSLGVCLPCHWLYHAHDRELPPSASMSNAMVASSLAITACIPPPDFRRVVTLSNRRSVFRSAGLA